MNLNFAELLELLGDQGILIEEVHILLDENKKLSKVFGNLAKTNLGGRYKQFIGENEFDQT